MGFDNVDIEKRKIAQQIARDRKKAAVNTVGRAKDRRVSGECRSRGDAITSFCSECITSYGLDVGGHGSILDAITACECQECHLWPWRRGKLVFDDDGGIV